jgi:hypothetical protein
MPLGHFRKAAWSDIRSGAMIDAINFRASGHAWMLLMREDGTRKSPRCDQQPG